MCEVKMNSYIEFQLYVIDMLERMKPTELSEFERISKNLHENLESAIMDYIYDERKNLSFDEYDYEPQC